MRGFLILAAFLCLLPAHGARAAVPASPAGVVEFLTGDVSISGGAAGAGTPLAAGTPVFAGNVIKTGPRARAVIHFIDDSRLTVGAAGTVTVADYAFDPAAGTGRAQLGILDAAFEFVDGRLGKAKNPDVRLDLNFGAIGIRGTKILRGMKDGKCWIFLEEGSAEVFNNAGRTVLAPGQGTTMKHRQISPGAPQAWTAADVAWIRAALHP